MSRFQFRLAGGLFALALLAPFENSMADQGNNADRGNSQAAGALALPISGSVTGGGTFAGSVTINRFALKDGQLVALGFVRGTITSAAGLVVASGLRPVTLPV